jgi:hypothetical protein
VITAAFGGLDDEATTRRHDVFRKITKITKRHKAGLGHV